MAWTSVTAHQIIVIIVIILVIDIIIMRLILIYLSEYRYYSCQPPTAVCHPTPHLPCPTPHPQSFIVLPSHLTFPHLAEPPGGPPGGHRIPQSPQLCPACLSPERLTRRALPGDRGLQPGCQPCCPNLQGPLAPRPRPQPGKQMVRN